MASFTGTNTEFRRYIGPRLRNLVQQFTKKHKGKISACEHCGSTENLESAHVHGRNRNEIIDLVLANKTPNGTVTVDLGEFEEQFKLEHQPLEKAILILCHSCHKKYDSNKSTSHRDPSESNEQINSSVLPITLEPSDPNVFKNELLRTKLAVIETIFSDGKVESKLWNASRFSSTSNVFGNLRSRPEYRSGNWQLRGIIKVHVQVVGRV